jgi:hypothetical protein
MQNTQQLILRKGEKHMAILHGSVTLQSDQVGRCIPYLLDKEYDKSGDLSHFR